MAASVPAERGSFRPELEGLRAVAVVLIVLYHAGVTQLGGGYIGVDVFFVLSGYLITGILVRDLDARGTIGLAGFYARRARRILPASFLVLLATLVAAWVVLTPIRFWRLADDIAAAALYVPNMLFATQKTGYLHPVRTSAVLHYWSLGVEEQFYLVWPALLLVFHRLGWRTGRRLAIPVALTVGGSLLLSAVGTAVKPDWAFFILPTRAWELGAGALLATSGEPLQRLGRTVSTGLAAIGLGLIAVAAVALDASTPYPGVAAAVPVVGSALVIAAGMRGWDAAPLRALATPPARFVGRISYSLYLWHWPVLLLGATVLAGTGPVPLQVAGELALSVLLAAATYRWVEDPLRRGRLVGSLSGRNLRQALAGSAVVVAIALLGAQLVVVRLPSIDASNVGVVAGDPLAGLVPPASPPVDGPLPANLAPSLFDPSTWTHIGSPTCSLADGQVVPVDCAGGDPAGSTTVVVFGDSHVQQWYTALDLLAAVHHWRLLPYTKNGCPYEDVTVAHGGNPFPECDAWRSQVLDRIAALHPAVVIVAGNHRNPPVAGQTILAGDAATAALAAGAQRTVTRLRAGGAAVAVLGDSPELPFDPIDCLSRNPEHVLACAFPRDPAIDPAWLAAEQAATSAGGATFVATDAWICSSDPCWSVVGRYLVFQDTNHLTEAFAEALRSRLDARLAAILP